MSFRTDIGDVKIVGGLGQRLEMLIFGGPCAVGGLGQISGM